MGGRAPRIAAVGRAKSEGLSHLESLGALIGEQADDRRDRRIARRIGEVRFVEERTLVDNRLRLL